MQQIQEVHGGCVALALALGVGWYGVGELGKVSHAATFWIKNSVWFLALHQVASTSKKCSGIIEKVK